MKLIKPSYVSKFQCKAGDCLDTCCSDWEIDIDAATFEKYRALRGEFGDELRRCICTDGAAHFSLSKNGDCPFLDNDGLCRIISTLGEGWLCDICREHPRYYNRIGGAIECGIGLACEAAAELILSCALPLSFDIEEVADEDEAELSADGAEFVLSVRNELFKLAASEREITHILSCIYDYAEDLDDRLFDIQCGLCSVTNAPSPARAEANVLNIFSASYPELSSLEALDDGFYAALDEAKKQIENRGLGEKMLAATGHLAKRLLTYFIHRYVGGATYDGCLRGRIRLSVCCTLAICLIAASRGAVDLSSFSSIAGNFSKSLEYSTENADRLIDFLS